MSPDSPARTSGGARAALGVTALVILAGAVGYLLGSRGTRAPSEPPPLALNPDYVTKHPEGVNPSELITVRTTADAEALRSRLIELVFGNDQLPDTLPRVEPSILDPGRDAWYAPLTESVETLVVDMDHGLVARAVHFVPREGSGDVVILHDGHDESVLVRHREIAGLLEHGFEVVALSMPLIAPNSTPEVSLANGETMTLTRHSQLRFVPPEHGHALRYFVEPVIQVVNHLAREGPDRRIGMLGVSGGGWTTVMVAALDPRISTSIPVAGSFPLYLRSMNGRDWGDWEETVPDIFSSIGYLDLYVLGSSGCSRRQVQVFYEHDPCCYAGTAATVYGPAVADASGAIGGSFEVVIDSQSGGHGFSRLVMQRALDELEHGRGQPCR